MSQHQKEQWQNHAKNSKPVGFGFPNSITGISFFNRLPYLQGKRAANGAGQITGPNALSSLEAKGFEVLRRMTSVSNSSGGWSSPRRNTLTFSNQLQRESGVNFFDSPKSYFGKREWVSNQNRISTKFHAGQNVIDPNQGQQKDHYRGGLKQVLGEPNCLSNCKSAEQQASYGSEVARAWSFVHTPIVSCQETIDVN